MDVREKLVEILRKTRYEYRRYIAMKDMEKRMAKTEEEFLAIDDSILGEIPFCADYLLAHGVTVQKWIPASEPPKEHDSIWAKLYGTKSWQPGLFRKCSYDVLACVEKKDGSRRVISIRTYDGKWDHNKLNEETVVCWKPMPQPPKVEV